MLGPCVHPFVAGYVRVYHVDIIYTVNIYNIYIYGICIISYIYIIHDRYTIYITNIYIYMISPILQAKHQHGHDADVAVGSPEDEDVWDSLVKCHGWVP